MALGKDDVVGILELLWQGFKQTEVAELFGVSKAVVWGILNDKTWTHVHHPFKEIHKQRKELRK